MRYFIGLDNGGTMTKAAIFDRNGREIAVCGMSTKVMTPKPDFIERDMEEMWDANCAVLRGVLEKSGVDPAEVSGIGISGHGKGLYLWGKDGRPCGYGIVSTDNRAYRYPEIWDRDGTARQTAEMTLMKPMACQPAALLAWIRDHEPERYRNIRYVFACKDYVRFRLTGEAKAEMTDCSGSGLMNLRTKAYDPKLLSLYGLAGMEEALPPLCEATKICGHVTKEAAARCGLAEGTPVIGGMFDIDACAIAAGITDPTHICAIAGTWSVNEYIRREPAVNANVMNSVFCLPEYYLIEDSSATGAGNNEWFIKNLLPELADAAKKEKRSIYEIIDEWVEEISPREFVPVFLPFLMASNVHPNAKAAFVGLNASHTRKHLMRSVFEGITMSHRYHIDKLLATRKEKPAGIRLAGGAAKADVWAQMFADVLQLPVSCVAADETGALGCAIAAAYAAGEYASIEEAASNMTSVSRTFMPDPELAEVYDRKYRLYRKTIDCLDGLWQEMQAVIEQ